MCWFGRRLLDGVVLTAVVI